MMIEIYYVVLVSLDEIKYSGKKGVYFHMQFKVKGHYQGKMKAAGV